MLDALLGQRHPEFLLADIETHPQRFLAVAPGGKARILAQPFTRLVHHQAQFRRLAWHGFKHIGHIGHLHAQPFHIAQFRHQRAAPLRRGRQHRGAGEVDCRHDQLRHLLRARLLYGMAEDRY